MRAIAEIAPPNSVVLLMDRSVGEIPDAMSGRLVAATSTCVAVGTLSEHDGLTRITLADESAEGATDRLVFDGMLETPSGTLSVCSVLDEVVLQIAVQSARTRVHIWADDDTEPANLRIVVGDVEADPAQESLIK